ncbi:hypothetical protein Agub_g15847 [Astrephomene gubernaculifera]|uniref:Uncharacterized protein n=1 Tax=Astrephomene gubernaculifera TaxID=47775 RepID=A0AAD3E3Q0_9CHLO|nr:hypothetical protein Agub_g15847 [Astrephomene gubernaculifera]
MSCTLHSSACNRCYAERHCRASCSKSRVHGSIQKPFIQTPRGTTPLTAGLSQLGAFHQATTQGRSSWVCRAGAIDGMPAWTLDQIAGLVFGAVMVAFVAGSRQVDVWVARAQRRQLGLCEECGGVYEPGSCAQGNCPAKKQQRLL